MYDLHGQPQRSEEVLCKAAHLLATLPSLARGVRSALSDMHVVLHQPWPHLKAQAGTFLQECTHACKGLAANDLLASVPCELYVHS